jgi:WhiB family redox-sensing transcriptional regulator
LPSAPFSGLADQWRQRARCRETDPALFFPVGTTPTALEEAEAAKAVCTRCPVREPCLEFALQTNQQAGIWGGTTEEERRAVYRQRRAARQGR